jgi:glycosyltransferase involved in cell wall biosynthesis
MNSEVINPKPSVSLVIPGYNEAAIVLSSLMAVYEYMEKLNDKYDWEIIFINDGSSDSTGQIAEEFAETHPMVKVYHHIVNLDLGCALRTGFSHVNKLFTITLDIDLSYAPYHIGEILETLIDSKADIVIASPYMKGGKVTAVPFMRKIMSRGVNRFMQMASQDKLHTFTSMVRGYRTSFLKSLNLKTKNFEISPEILYKSMILRARIVEIPAHLDWTEQNKLITRRRSGMRFVRNIFSNLMAAFIFRPYIFFLIVGFVLLILAIYMITWIFINTFKIMPQIILEDPQFFDDRFSNAIGYVFNHQPHSFMVGGITLLAAIQFLSMGFISLQQKRYFEEMFNISTSVLKQHQDN